MFVLKINRIFLTALLTVCACVAVAANLGPDDQQISFTGAPGTVATDAFTPAICFSPDTERYLVVWSADETDGDFHIYGQLLNGGSGAPIGAPFLISSPGVVGSDHRQPAVAYSPVSGTFLVVWSSDSLNLGAYEIMGQRVANGGALVAGNIRLSDMGSDDTEAIYDALTPDVIWQAVSQVFVVVWAGDDDLVPVGDGRFEVYGQLVNSATGNETGANDFRITDAGVSNDYDVLRPALTAQSGTDRWYLAFEADLTSDGFHDSEIWSYGGAADVPDASGFLVSSMGGAINDGFSARNCDVAYLSNLNQLIFVWDGVDGPGQTRQIYGQRMLPDGAPSGSLIALSEPLVPLGGFREAIWPVIAVDPLTDDWFVAWQADLDDGTPYFDHEVWAGRFDEAGASLVGAAIPLSAMDPALGPVAGAGRPALAINTSFHSKMIAWSGDLSSTPGGENEIFTQGWVDGAVSAVDDTPTVGAFALYGAAPNPFNPMTTIAFNLPRSENVTLRIYDLSGRLVRTLLSGESRAEGRNEVVWNGRDENDRATASGVYFYRLETPRDQAQGRMTLVK